MFTEPRARAAVSLALSLLFLAGCAAKEPAATSPSPSPKPSPSAPALEGVADSFVNLGGSAPAPSWADRVSVYVGGEKAAELRATQADDPSSWRVCPPGAAEYAMRKCPASPFRTMDLLAQEGGTVVYEEEVPTRLGCDIVAALPEWEHSRSITIRPDPAHRNCFSDFSITLYVDDEERISAVNLTVGSP